MRAPGLIAHHLRYINLSFWRNPSAAFFGIVFPLMVLLINSTMFGNAPVTIHGVTTTVASFYVAGMSVFAVAMTCFTNLATAVLFDRDMGRLKRIRATPTPVLAYVVARLTFAMFAGLLATMLCVGAGAALFGVRIAPMALVEFAGVVLFGGACFAALSLAVVGLVANAQAGPAVLNAMTFPVLFVSNVFYPIDRLPPWLLTITNALPVRPLANAATASFFGTPVAMRDLMVLGAWGLGGALVAAAKFNWQPRR
ncbi:ABC transporter permease [Sphingomonas sp.]|uniref:ABC transporter permease n=1 Tax=Sphingomonas sp. TaxID=28214 RepID=UPI001AFE7F92|nr:ABC transporter permease [Sphingomonas sp.]MBO9713412.1 ABC transporter permease [Sphingomonas sp.]